MAAWGLYTGTKDQPSLWIASIMATRRAWRPPSNWASRKESMISIFSVGMPAALGLLLFDLCNIVINRLAAGED